MIKRYLEEEIPGDSQHGDGRVGEFVDPVLGCVMLGDVDGEVWGVGISRREAMPGPRGAIVAGAGDQGGGGQLRPLRVLR